MTLSMSKELVNSRLHIPSDQAMHMRRRLNIVHPVELLRPLPRVRSGNACTPHLVRVARVTVTIRRQRLRQSVAVLIGHDIHHESEDVVVDELAAVRGLRETGFDGGVGVLDHLAPGVDAAAVGAEVLSRDGRFVLGVDVGDEDVGSACIDEEFGVVHDALRDVVGEVGVVGVAEPEGIGVLAQVVLAGPDELHGLLDAGWCRVRIVQSYLVVD